MTDEDIDKETFRKLFCEAAERLNLTDVQISEHFSASIPTAKRWRSGASAPMPGVRKIIIEAINALEKKDENDQGCP